MLHPSIDQLMELKQIDSKYTLVVAAAKRARQLQVNSLKEEETETKKKFVGEALTEILNNKINIVTPSEQVNSAKK